MTHRHVWEVVIDDLYRCACHTRAHWIELPYADARALASPATKRRMALFGPRKWRLQMLAARQDYRGSPRL